MESALNIILSHQPANAIARMIDFWSGCVPRESIVIAYGGTQSEFEAIKHKQKYFVDDPGLRTRDHQREFQSYTRVFRLALEFLKTRRDDFQFVYFAEYDHLPLVPDLNQRQIARLTDENADIFGFHVQRIDDTSSAHFLYHASDDRFMKYWASISRRPDREVVLSMFGSGSFWTKRAFCQVSEWTEPFPIYLELYLPTLAHHLGFRVRNFTEQNRYVRALEDEICGVEQARREGAWTLHPVKRLWGT